jgi:hypothetical protein
MFILQILLGIVIGQLLGSSIAPLISYQLPRTILYSIKGEMKPYAFLLWFLKPTLQIIIVYTSRGL